MDPLPDIQLETTVEVVLDRSGVWAGLRGSQVRLNLGDANALAAALFHCSLEPVIGRVQESAPPADRAHVI